MWHEFEGYRTYTKDAKPRLEITKQRQLVSGAEVTIFEKKIGGEVVSRISVRIRDENNVMIIAERPQEPTIEAGNFAVFPYQIPGHIATNAFEVTKQDVTIALRGKVSGVLWTNEKGEKPKPFTSTLGRSYYGTDTDPETQRKKEEMARLNKLAAKGKIRGGAGGPGI